MLPVGLLNLLLVAAHEALSRPDALCNLGVVDLEEQAELSCGGVFDFRDLVPRAPNLDKLLDGDRMLGSRLLRLQLLRVHGPAVPRVARCSSRQVGLVLLALRVRQVRAFVRMQRQTQAALDPAQVVAEDVRVLQGRA